MDDALFTNLIFGIFGALMAVASIASALGALASHGRASSVARTPTTPVARATAGPVEIEGIGEEPAEPLPSPFDGVRCAWLEIDLRAARGSGSARDVTPLGTVVPSAELWLRDATGRACVEMTGAVLEMRSARDRRWPSVEAIDVPAVRALVLERVRALSADVAGYEIECAERRILPGEPVHVTGVARPERGPTGAYRAPGPVVRIVTADGVVPTVAPATEAALLAHHRDDARFVAAFSVVAAVVAALLLAAWLVWQPIG